MPSETDDDDHQRNRGPSFTTAETNLLLDLVEKHKQIILNPDYKTPSVRAKERAWKLLQKELNSKLNTERTVDSLKNKWKNLKTVAKKVARSSELQCQETDISRINSISYDSSAHCQEDDSDSDGSTSKRSRSDKFAPDEVKLLLECVRNEKKYIMNPDCKEDANNQKEQAWARVTEEFNSQNATTRTLTSLRNKFVNMKHNIIAKNKEILKSEPGDEDGATLSEIKKNIKKCPDNGEGSDSMFADIRADSGDDKDCNDSNSDSSDDSNSKQRRHRSGNFTLEESQLLLKCVRDVKDIVLSTSSDSATNVKKLKAWKKVTRTFNQQSACPRSMNSLKYRFKTMKKQAKTKIAQINAPEINVTGMQSDSHKRIKQEPLTYDDDDGDDDDYMEVESPELNHVAREKTLYPTRTTNVDPLDIVLNGPVANDYNHIEESSEIAKKKLELLKYRMETAELERQRVNKLLNAEQMEHQLKATEMALRLRTARLEMAAAEAKLPPNHPALVFGPQEILAQTYMHVDTQNHNSS